MHEILKDVTIFVTDFDETLTTEDSMELVGAAAYKHKPEFNPRWDFFASAYADDFKEHCSAQNSDCSDCNSIPETKLEREERLQRGMHVVEDKSVRRVEASGLFCGVPLERMLDEAVNVKVRDGWWQLYGQLSAHRISVVIASVNWSAELIGEVMRRGHALAFSGDSENKCCVEYARVFANEMEIDNNGRFTGRMKSVLRTGADKKLLLRELKETVKSRNVMHSAADEAQGKSQRNLVCYCGDSGTDFLALVEADIGIIVGRRASLLNKAKACGVDVVPLKEAGLSTPPQRETDVNKRLYLIESWSELL
jgi:2-hydroxy-3-keto-5-methylthiopentenyl-1-phosphate phosphatase